MNCNETKCKKITCKAGREKIVFKYDGLVFPCEAFKEAPNKDRFILGDIAIDDLETLWIRADNNPFLNELKIIAKANGQSCPAQILYKQHDNEFVIPECCQDTIMAMAIEEEVKKCGGNCRAKRLFEILRIRNEELKKKVEELENAKKL